VTATFYTRDPEGLVVWTPQMLERVYPFGRMMFKPRRKPKISIGDIWSQLRDTATCLWPLFVAGRRHPRADPEVYSWLEQAYDRLQRLDYDRSYTGAPEVDAALLHFAEPCDLMRAAPLTAAVVDLYDWFGLDAAVERMALAHTMSCAQAPSLGSFALTLPGRPGRGASLKLRLPALVPLRVSHNPSRAGLQEQDIDEALQGGRKLGFFLSPNASWPRLRRHLSSSFFFGRFAPARRAAERWKDFPDPVVQHLIAFCFPDEPAWAEAVARRHPGHSLHTCLSASVRDPGLLPHVSDDYFLGQGDAARLSMLAAAGPTAAPFLVKSALKKAAPADAAHAASLLACIGTREALALLAAHRADPVIGPAYSEARARFPHLGAG
jgi:hypothetical protein